MKELGDRNWICFLFKIQHMMERYPSAVSYNLASRMYLQKPRIVTAVNKIIQHINNCGKYYEGAY